MRLSICAHRLHGGVWAWWGINITPACPCPPLKDLAAARPPARLPHTHLCQVYDIAWGGVGIFASVSADGSVRVFDLRWEQPAHPPAGLRARLPSRLPSGAARAHFCELRRQAANPRTLVAPPETHARTLTRLRMHALIVVCPQGQGALHHHL